MTALYLTRDVRNADAPGVLPASCSGGLLAAKCGK